MFLYLLSIIIYRHLTNHMRDSVPIDQSNSFDTSYQPIKIGLRK